MASDSPLNWNNLIEIDSPMVNTGPNILENNNKYNFNINTFLCFLCCLIFFVIIIFIYCNFKNKNLVLIDEDDEDSKPWN